MGRCRCNRELLFQQPPLGQNAWVMTAAKSCRLMAGFVV